MSGWKTIDSAPKGISNYILLYTGFGIVEGYWHQAHKRFKTFVCEGSCELEDQPTHWMPLPKPPKDS